MTKAQRRKQALVEDLVKITIERGITNEDLQVHVDDLHLVTLNSIPEVSRQFKLKVLAHSQKIYLAGRTAQLSYLLDVLGERKLSLLLLNNGSFLDGFVRRFSSDPEQVEQDIGKDRVNGNGDPD